MTESPTAWETQYNSELDEEGQSKAPECAENFITLLLAITGLCWTTHQCVEAIVCGLPGGATARYQIWLAGCVCMVYHGHNE